MEDYMKERPSKKVFDQEKIISLRSLAINIVKSKLLPSDKINKIVLIGSSVKKTFGEYDPPGFRGSLFSDFDFIVFVEDDYVIPDWFEREPDGKPFSNSTLNLAYRNKNVVDGKYDAEVFFVRKSSVLNSDIVRDGESAGIPMTDASKHKYMVVYSR